MLGDLPRDGSLARDHGRIVERRDYHLTSRLGERMGFVFRVVEGIADHFETHPRATEKSDAVHFLPRRIPRHKNRPTHFEEAAASRDTLRVVAGACADNSRIAFGCAQEAHAVVGSTDFIGANRLQILPLEINARAVLLGQTLGELERRAADNGGDGVERGVDIGSGERKRHSFHDSAWKSVIIEAVRFRRLSAPGRGCPRP